MAGKKAKQVSQTNQTVNTSRDFSSGPLEAQSANYNQLWQSAQDAFNRTDRSGQLNNFERQAQDSAVRAAGNTGQGVPELRQLALAQIRGDYLNPESNPNLRGAMDAAVNPIQLRLQRQIMPGISDRAVQQGAYGGSRQGVAEGVAAGEFAREALDATNRIAYDNYARERQIQQQSAPMLAQAGELDLAGSRILAALGQGQRNLAESAPWTGMDRYAQILGAGGFRRDSGTGVELTDGTTTTTGRPAGGGLGGLISGGLGGASALSAAGPPGMAIGGILGGLGGLFG
jgi:hypothetical protein